MSDFDEVLERLVTDPVFRVALEADPEAALRGYRLDDEERGLLRAQVDLGDSSDRSVEDRVSKSGLFGMVGPVISALGFLSPPEGTEAPPLRQIPDDSHFGPQQPAEAVGVLETGPVTAVTSASGTLETAGPGTLEVGHGPSAGTPAKDYHTRVDADGDGQWDPHQAVERGDGGVDILVDRDRDGVVDWVAHDYDRDGLIEDVDVDMDHDGLLDTRFVDDTGDGWLDRRA